MAQLRRLETVHTRSEHCSPMVAGSIHVRVNFFLNLFCSNTILTELPELSILEKTDLNSLNSVTKNICHYSKRVWACHHLFKRPGDHSTSNTHVRDSILRLSPIHASVIYQIRWISVPFSENSNGAILFRGPTFYLLSSCISDDVIASHYQTSSLCAERTGKRRCDEDVNFARISAQRRLFSGFVLWKRRRERWVGFRFSQEINVFQILFTARKRCSLLPFPPSSQLPLPSP